MSIQHTSRTGKVYYLHTKTGPSGKIGYFFTLENTGDLAPAIPEGYELI